MGVIRRLVTVVELQADKAAKALAAYDRLWKQTAKSIDGYAASVEADANRVVAATQRMAAAMATVPRLGRGGGGGGGAPRGGGAGDGGGGGGVTRIKNAPTAKGPRKGGDDLDRAIAAANKEVAAAQKAAAVRAAQHERRESDRANSAGQTAARMSGLKDGAVQITKAADALSILATKSDKAKASIKDLEAQVARNRKEMADLKAQSLATGDADGTLAARMKGLAVATGQATVQLSDARRGLRALDGGLIDAINNSKKFSVSLSAISVAAGNLISAGVSRVFSDIKGAIFGATEKAINFETGLTNIAKVARGTDDTAEGFERIKAGIMETSKALGVIPTEVADLTAQLAPAFSGVKEGASDTAVDIVKLTEDVTKIGVAWGITGKEAGKSFAEISSGLQLTTEQTKSLFGGINEVGNQLGVNAATLAEAVQRSAGVLKGANVAGETGAALNAVLIKTGSSAEVAATGVRTFIGRLGAGETKGQLKAFETLGLDFKELRKELANGDAEGQIKKVVDALGGLQNEQRLEVLSELFGTESIGSIGAAATASELLATSFKIMGDKAASATSVQKEFDRVSNTSAAKMATLKANIDVLAISFGQALLPHIKEVVDYLTSEEGQEWGRSAVEGLVGSVKSLVEGLQAAWPVVQAIGGAISSFTEAVGGSTIAVGLLTAGLLALTGPFVAVPVLATAAGAAIGQFAVDSITAGRDLAEQTASNMADVATSLGQGRDKFAVLRDILGEVAQSTDRSRAAWAAWMQQMLGATGAVERFYDAEQAGKIRSGRISEDAARKQAVDAARLAHAQRTKAAKEANDANIVRSQGRGRLSVSDGAFNDASRFDALSAKVRAGQKLKPSEAKEYTALSKKLDEAKATKGGKGHKATKMDRQLAAMDPSLRGVLTRGGETDAGGDLKRADNVLDRAVFAKATGSGGGGGSSPGPGPNVTTIYNDNKTLVNVQVDASSSGPVAENIRQAAQDLGASASSVRFTGQAKVVANRNAGGRMA